MSIKKTLAQLLVFAILEVGALGGVPMNPEKIRRLMQVMHETKAEYVVKNESDDDGPESKPGSAVARHVP